MKTAQAATWDVVVIGAGLAGSLVADRLSNSGARVLLLESGPPRTAAPQPAGAGRWPGPIMLEHRPGRFRRAAAALLGYGPGGSSALYGAALGRFADEDFAGTRPADPNALPTRWPVDAVEMAPWYSEAERRLGVGLEQPLVSERDRAIADVLVANGHEPYRLPVSIAYRPGCGECQGQRCARACKGEGWTRILADTVREGRAELRCNAHVRDVEVKRGGTLCLRLESGEEIRARKLVLAAGALNTPRLLLNSPRLFENGPHPMIGRGLMFHSTDLFTVGVDRALSLDGPKKTLALRDFYDLPEGARGGEIQSLGFDLAPRLVSRYLSELLSAWGVPGGPYLMAALRIPAAIMARRLGEPPVLATILEDLPYHENRVLAAPAVYSPDQPIEVAYTVKPELEARAKAMRAAIHKAFAPLDVKFLLKSVSPNLGHPCGTVRMGTDPETDPVDEFGRLRCVAAQVFVADASVFPSSGGANPGLTVAANALRISDAMVKASKTTDATSKLRA